MWTRLFRVNKLIYADKSRESRVKGRESNEFSMEGMTVSVSKLIFKFR